MGFLVWLVFLLGANGYGASWQKKPKVVSAFVGADEVVLDLLSHRPKSILALSPLSKDPRYSAVYEKAGGFSREFGAELESLIALKPDVVLVASYTRGEWLRLLEIAKIKAYVLEDFNSLSDIKNNILRIGHLVGEESSARQLVAKMENDISRLNKSCLLKGHSVLNYNRQGRVIGKGTIYDSLLQKVGIINVGSKMGVQGWQSINRESLLMSQPDYIIIPRDFSDPKEVKRELALQPGWQHLAAVKNGKFIFVPGRYLSSVSHYIVSAMKIICRGAAHAPS